MYFGCLWPSFLPPFPFLLLTAWRSECTHYTSGAERSPHSKVYTLVTRLATLVLFEMLLHIRVKVKWLYDLDAGELSCAPNTVMTLECYCQPQRGVDGNTRNQKPDHVVRLRFKTGQIRSSEVVRMSLRCVLSFGNGCLHVVWMIENIHVQNSF